MGHKSMTAKEFQMEKHNNTLPDLEIEPRTSSTTVAHTIGLANGADKRGRFMKRSFTASLS